MTIKQRIISFLQNHPEGIDDDELAKILELKQRQQANVRCRELEKEGLITRRPVGGKIQNYWKGSRGDVPPVSTPKPRRTIMGLKNGSGRAIFNRGWWAIWQHKAIIFVR